MIVQDSMKMRRRNVGSRYGPKEIYEDGPGKKMMLKKPLEVTNGFSGYKRSESLKVEAE